MAPAPRARGHDQELQRPHEGSAARTKLGSVDEGEPFEQSLAPRRDFDQYLTPVCVALLAPYKTALFQAVDEFDSAVVAKEEAFGEVTDTGDRLFRNAFQGKEQLVLRRIDSRLACRIFAEMMEAADLVAELGQ